LIPLSAHIQLHRRQAFPEVALFSRKMCGLPKADTKQPELTTPPSSMASNSPSQYAAHGASPGLADGGLRGGQAVALQNTSTSSATASPSVSNTGQEGGKVEVFVQDQTADFTGFDGMLQDSFPMDGLLWDPSIFPSSFPTPWFAADKGAAGLYQPLQEEPAFLPPMNGFFTGETGYIGGPLEDFGVPNSVFVASRSVSDISPAPANLSYKSSISATSDGQSTPPKPPPKTHKAWGVDVKRRPAQFSMPSSSSVDGASGLNSYSSIQDSDEDMDEDAVVVGPDGPFPPGISLQRCATAAHTIVRLEVLHRSATMALWKGP
jgi:hypothetical protein